MESGYFYPELADMHLVLGEYNRNATDALRRCREKYPNQSVPSDCSLLSVNPQLWNVDVIFPTCVCNVWMEVQILMFVTTDASVYCTLQDQQSVQEVVPHSATARCAFCQCLNNGPETPYLQERFYIGTSHA
jgi:hypothetical protein